MRTPAKIIDKSVVDRLRHAVKGMDFGVVLMEIYDGKVVGVQAAPSKTFTLISKYDAGAGI